MSILGVIPARLESRRFPRKLLRSDTGKPLIQHTWENAAKAKSLQELVIATDSSEIISASASFGGKVVQTKSHESGSDRVAEVAEKMQAFEIIVNIQGDEPEIPPKAIDQLVQAIEKNPSVSVATLATPISTDSQLNDPDCVKVVADHFGDSVYFSRFPIPFLRNEVNEKHSVGLMHIGVYAFRREFLLDYSSWEKSPLEISENLEQLRIIENGHKIRICVVENHQPGIDSLKDYLGFVERMKRRIS